MNEKETALKAFLGRPEKQVGPLFSGQRFPNVVVCSDGTVVATWGSQSCLVRRSEDGGETWGPLIEVATPGFHGGGTVAAETEPNLIIFNDVSHPPRTPQPEAGPLEVYQSRDHGKNWARIAVTIHPDRHGNVPSRHMAEHGVCLRYGPRPGRLLRTARVYNPPGARPPRYTLAIYSDDGGFTWHSSAPFPETGTGESALVELADGRVFFTARKSCFDTDPDRFHARRHVALSRDAGETWTGLRTLEALPDGPRYRGGERRGSNYNGHFGMLAGLARLPLADRDILLYSNADTPDHRRIRGTVWASFDGGDSWPVKRLVHEGPFAYSSLAAGRPGTPSEGWLYLQFEGGKENCNEAGYLARFNLAWLLAGETTGDGLVPGWLA